METGTYLEAEWGASFLTGFGMRLKRNSCSKNSGAPQAARSQSGAAFFGCGKIRAGMGRFSPASPTNVAATRKVNRLY